MAVSLARLLSLVAVSTLAGIDGGLSTNGAQGGSGGELGGRPWNAVAAFLPSMPLKTGLGFFGAYAREESTSIRQVRG